jgi:hypothetical protein
VPPSGRDRGFDIPEVSSGGEEWDDKSWDALASEAAADKAARRSRLAELRGDMTNRQAAEAAAENAKQAAKKAEEDAATRAANAVVAAKMRAEDPSLVEIIARQDATGERDDSLSDELRGKVDAYNALSQDDPGRLAAAGKVRAVEDQLNHRVEEEVGHRDVAREYGQELAERGAAQADRARQAEQADNRVKAMEQEADNLAAKYGYNSPEMLKAMSEGHIGRNISAEKWNEIRSSAARERGIAENLGRDGEDVIRARADDIYAALKVYPHALDLLSAQGPEGGDRRHLVLTVLAERQQELRDEERASQQKVQEHEREERNQQKIIALEADQRRTISGLTPEYVGKLSDQDRADMLELVPEMRATLDGKYYANLLEGTNSRDALHAGMSAEAFEYISEAYPELAKEVAAVLPNVLNGINNDEVRNMSRDDLARMIELVGAIDQDRQEQIIGQAQILGRIDATRLPDGSFDWHMVGEGEIDPRGDIPLLRAEPGPEVPSGPTDEEAGFLHDPDEDGREYPDDDGPQPPRPPEEPPQLPDRGPEPPPRPPEPEQRRAPGGGMRGSLGLVENATGRMLRQEQQQREAGQQPFDPDSQGLEPRGWRARFSDKARRAVESIRGNKGSVAGAAGALAIAYLLGGSTAGPSHEEPGRSSIELSAVATPEASASGAIGGGLGRVESAVPKANVGSGERSAAAPELQEKSADVSFTVAKGGGLENLFQNKYNLDDDVSADVVRKLHGKFISMAKNHQGIYMQGSDPRIDRAGPLSIPGLTDAGLRKMIADSKASLGKA